MAILFYEGLPGSGKSYEAMSTQIIPLLLKGREVVAYIEGLETDECKDRICEASGLSRERLDELLFPLSRDDMRPREVEVVKNGKKVTQVIDGTWIEKTRDNAFHVYDEAQNWWPNRLRATEALTQLVTEHRHRGIDVLLMGQSLMDLLALWRRRVDQKFTFLKLTALGTDKRYRVTIFKGQGNDEFVKVTDKFGKYDPKYFGTYRSHVSDDINTETFTDKRASFMRSSFVTYALPLAALLLVGGVWKAWAFFHPEPATVPQSVSAPKGAGTAIAAAVVPSTGPGAAPVAKDERSPQERLLTKLDEKGRIRLSGLMEARGRIGGVVEWLDGNTRVIERMTLQQLRELGVSVLVVGDSVRLTVGDWVALATMWPVEAEGRVSEYRASTLRSSSDGVPGQAGIAPSSVAAAAPGLTFIDGGRREPAGDLSKQPARPGSRL